MCERRRGRMLHVHSGSDPQANLWADGLFADEGPRVPVHRRVQHFRNARILRALRLHHRRRFH